MTPTEIQKMIEAGLPGAVVSVTGDGYHFEARVVCAAFAGKSLIQQHQMVYRALGDNMREAIHALSIKTDVPAQS